MRCIALVCVLFRQREIVAKNGMRAQADIQPLFMAGCVCGNVRLECRRCPGAAFGCCKVVYGDLWVRVLLQVRLLRKDLFNHVAMHVGQAEIASGMVKCESLMVQAQAVQDGGLKIVDMNR